MILYKYLSPERVDILETGLVRYTPPDELNDPFEVEPRLGGLASSWQWLGAMALATSARELPEDSLGYLLRKQMTETGGLRLNFLTLTFGAIFLDHLAKAFLWQLQVRPDGFRSVLSPGFVPGFPKVSAGVLCLSETRDSAIMWAQYAANHAGFCIGVDSEHPYFGNGLQRVRYRRARPTQYLFSNDFLYVKSPEWRHEKEWRDVRLTETADQYADWNVFLFRLPPDCVREVVLGARVNPSVRDRVVELLDSNPGYTHVRLLQQSIHESRFAFELRPDPSRSGSLEDEADPDYGVEDAVEAAIWILKESDRPLHYSEISRRAIRRRIWKTRSKQPADAMRRQLAREVRTGLRGPRVIRVKRGIYKVSPRQRAGVPLAVARIPVPVPLAAPSHREGARRRRPEGGT